MDVTRSKDREAALEQEGKDLLANPVGGHPAQDRFVETAFNNDDRLDLRLAQGCDLTFDPSIEQ